MVNTNSIPKFGKDDLTQEQLDGLQKLGENKDGLEALGSLSDIEANDWGISKDMWGMTVGTIKEGIGAYLTYEMIELQKEYKNIKREELTAQKELGEKALTLQGEQNERMADLQELNIKYSANVENHKIDAGADVQKEKIKQDSLLALFTGREQYSFGQPAIY